jgi:hypothetical protein
MNQFSIPSESRAAQGFRRFLGKLSQPQSLRTGRYSPEEVRERLLRNETADPRTAAVHAAAAQTALWSNLVTDQIALELGRAGRRLPTILLWHRQGVSNHEIGRRLSPFGGAWDADRALAVTATLIAFVLNQGGG